jgi:hypothetical protein
MRRSSPSITLHRVGAGLALALLLAGCEEHAAPVQDNQAAGNDQVAVRAAKDAAATEPVPAQQAEPVLTAEGFGPLRIGMTLAEITNALGRDADPDAVGGPEPEQCDQFRPSRAPQGLLVMVENGRLTRISLIDGATIATDRGLKLGDTAAAVRAAYGPDLVAMPHKYSDPPAEYLTAWTKVRPAPDVTDPAARGIRYEIGEDGKVAMVHTGGESIQYVEGCL